MKNPKKIYQLYDKTYKKLFSHKRIVEDFIKGFVKEKFASRIEILEQVFTEFTTRRHKSYFSDVIWKAKFKGKDCYIFIIFEFLSGDDKRLVLRILNYLIQFYLKLIKNEKYMLPLPPVFPVVIYTGENNFSGKLNIRDIIEVGDKSLEKYIPSFEFFLLDISKLPKRAILRLMIYSRNLASLVFNVEKIDEERLSEEIIQIVKIIRKYANTQLIQDFQDFLFSIVPEENTEIIKIIDTIDKDKDMFYEKVKKWESKMVEKGENRGMQKGLEKGKIEGKIEGKMEGKIEGKIEGKMEGKIEGKIEGKMEVAKNLLKNRVDIHLISKATNLSINKIRALQKQI